MDAFIFLKSRILPILLVLNLLSSELGLVRQGSTLGINYGQVANNLPSPERVYLLLSSLKITKTRIYDTNPQVLAAFANSSIELIVTVPNEAVTQLASDPNQALQWVNTNIKPYVPSTKITGIAVGNEIYTDDDSQNLMSDLVPAMQAIHQALVRHHPRFKCKFTSRVAKFISTLARVIQT
ncbi:uncharacterized protein A4U43_C06F8900 [Asparagus officinalis]|uniref:Glucan endo-1,3-beta-D-glucosidase n=1 Tax=Asparagus officinalis TaxID=4686 RepID=A0A5P1EKT2_ASPOF|nr:uncharacterized protein A4U43_C06F8900 [Asparagus officinalis]